MADYEVLAPGGHENLINNITERLDEKAYIDGYYQQLTAGAADNLTGRGDGVAASYLYRTTGGDADVADGTATVKSIHGRTVRWNQLVSGMTAMTNQDGITTSYDETTHKFSITNLSRTENFLNGSTRNVVVPAERTVAGHKYVLYGNLPTGVKLSVAYSTNVNGVFTLTEANELRLRVTNDYDFVTAHPVGDVTSFYLNVTDLTAMFGSGNEPSTVAEFEALYPEPYYPYDAGSLLSVQMEGIETVGFNQWDEEWEKGYISDNTGQNAGSGNQYLRSKGYIDVFPSTTYYFRTATNIAGKVYFYDASEGYIGWAGKDAAGRMVETPSNCHKMRFWLNYTGDYQNDICINLSWSGYRDGEYEPYWKSERTIPATDLRSAGSVYDELTESAAVTRVGVYTFTGSETVAFENWRPVTDTYACLFPLSMIPDRKAYGSNTVPDAEMVELDAESYSNVYEGSIGFTTSSELSDTSYSFAVRVPSSVASTKVELLAWLAGKTLHYALATPTTQAIDPPLNLSYKVSDFGTERVMVPANEQSAPPTMQVVYGLNVVDTVRRLPTEYISHDSFTQFRLALGAKLGVFIVETWDETDGRYEYTINDA